MIAASEEESGVGQPPTAKCGARGVDEYLPRVCCIETCFSLEGHDENDGYQRGAHGLIFDTVANKVIPVEMPLPH